jgi:hypothetical protein
MPWFSGALPFLLTLASPADAVVDDAPSAVAQPGMRATASSVLVAKRRAKDRYAAERAIDGSLSTCWCEGAADVGKGEWIQIRMIVEDVYPGARGQDTCIAQIEIDRE